MAFHKPSVFFSVRFYSNVTQSIKCTPHKNLFQFTYLSEFFEESDFQLFAHRVDGVSNHSALFSAFVMHNFLCVYRTVSTCNCVDSRSCRRAHHSRGFSPTHKCYAITFELSSSSFDRVILVRGKASLLVCLVD
jgi:hypothetical protein